MENRELSRADLERLFADGSISESCRGEVLAAYRSEIGWRGWIWRCCGALGAVLLLAGVVFFFAANWKGMSPTVRIGSVETLLAVAVLGACLASWRGLAGLSQLLFAAAAVLCGVVLAVFGQVYQTGADSFEVFALWAALSLPWVLAARLAGLWLFWFAVLQTSLALYAGQVLVPEGRIDWSSARLALGLLSALGLVGWEWLHSRFGWLGRAWMRPTLATAASIWLVSLPMFWIFDFVARSEGEGARALGTLVWAAVFGAATWFYRRHRPSAAALGAFVLPAAAVLVAALARGILSSSGAGTFGFLVTGLFAVGVFAMAGWFLADSARAADRARTVVEGKEQGSRPEGKESEQ